MEQTLYQVGDILKIGGITIVNEESSHQFPIGTIIQVAAVIKESSLKYRVIELNTGDDTMPPRIAYVHEDDLVFPNEFISSIESLEAKISTLEATIELLGDKIETLVIKLEENINLNNSNSSYNNNH